MSTPRVNRGRFGLSEWEKKVSERKIGGVVLRGNPPPPGSEFGKRGQKKKETGIGRQRKPPFMVFVCGWSLSRAIFERGTYLL